MTQPQEQPVPQRKAHTMFTVRGRATLCVCEENDDHIEEQLLLMLMDDDDDDGMAA